MKQLLFILFIAIIFNSCASLYTTPTNPTPFLEKEDGYAIQGAVGTNMATNIVSVGATKAVSRNVCVNVSGLTSFMGNYNLSQNPFTNSKKINQFAANIGFNTRKITVYPMQVWLGVHAGTSSDSYVLAPWETTSTNNVKPSLDLSDTLSRFELAKGSYIGTRIGLTHMILSNYENDLILKDRKKLRFDCIGTLNITPVSYQYSNSNIAKAKSNLIGYNTNIRLHTSKWIFGLNLDLFANGTDLINDIVGNKNPAASIKQMPSLCIPSIHYTRFFRNKSKI